jgi:hypothetical protein
LAVADLPATDLPTAGLAGATATAVAAEATDGEGDGDGLAALATLGVAGVAGVARLAARFATDVAAGLAVAGLAAAALAAGLVAPFVEVEAAVQAVLSPAFGRPEPETPTWPYFLCFCI